jgi:hypothetical protein
MSETISLPPLKKYVPFCTGILSLILCVLCFLWFVCHRQWDTLICICIAMNSCLLISFLASIASRHLYTKFYPKTISIDEGVLYVKHADPIYAIQAGYQEEYSLSECVWYQGYIDNIVLISFGFVLLPINFKRGITIFHIPTSKHIECGFTRESYNQWCLYLRDANVHECRQISRFSPIIIFLFFYMGLSLGLTLIYLIGNLCSPLLVTLLTFFLSVAFALFGCYLSGYDYRVLKLKEYFVCVFLAILFFAILYGVEFFK